eukprot:10312111-Heterocapsa_arctica.AAC.1
MKVRRLLGAMLAPPCSTFLPARDRTSVIRTQLFPWGLAATSDQDREKVKIGNACLHAALEIIQKCDEHNVLWRLENPHGSKMWYIPELIRLATADH